MDLRKVRDVFLAYAAAIGQEDGPVVDLTAEAVQSATLALEGIDHVHGSDGLALSVLSVGDGIPDDVLQEHLEHTSGLLVDETGDTLHTASTSKTADGGLGDTLDVVAENLAVTLGASLSEPLASFATASHGAELAVRYVVVLR